MYGKEALRKEKKKTTTYIHIYKIYMKKNKNSVRQLKYAKLSRNSKKKKTQIFTYESIFVYNFNVIIT